MEEVKLLGGWFSPFVLRVEWALKLKGIQYEVVEEDLVNKSPLLLECNPTYKRIPVLVHNGNPIAESLVIIEYIDENWKYNPILPQEPYEKAMAHFWAKFIEEKLTEIIRGVILSQGEQQEKLLKQAMDSLEVLEGELNCKKFFGGDTIGYVDIILGWISIWFVVIEEVNCVKIFDPEKYPHLDKWMQNFVECPVIKENMPQHDKLVQYFHGIRQFTLASTAQK